MVQWLEQGSGVNPSLSLPLAFTGRASGTCLTPALPLCKQRPALGAHCGDQMRKWTEGRCSGMGAARASPRGRPANLVLGQSLRLSQRLEG